MTNRRFHPPGLFGGYAGSNLVVFGGVRRLPQSRLCYSSAVRGQTASAGALLFFAFQFASHLRGWRTSAGFLGVIYLCFIAKMQVHFFRAAASQNVFSPDEFGCNAISQQ